MLALRLLTSVSLALRISAIELPLNASLSTDESNLTPCSVLASLLPQKVSSPGDATYVASSQSYFFKQARLSPRCIVRPKSSADVSSIVKTLVRTGTRAAIRGGGHTPFAGASSIDDAVTIDLSSLNMIEVNPTNSDAAQLRQLATNTSNTDRQNHDDPEVGNELNISVDMVSVGGGATWGAVYAKLQGTGFVPVGGRGPSLGVGGLTTGGKLRSAFRRNGVE